MDKEALKEKAKYDLIWRDCNGYRDCSPGEMFARFFFEGFEEKIKAGQSIIDFGCGTARVAKSFLMKGLKTTLVDISVYSLDEEMRGALSLFSEQLRFVEGCLWSLPEDLEAAEWIYCCDVMEHIPTHLVDQVLEQVASRMKLGGYFSICLQEDLVGKKVGFPLHLTVKDQPWWEEKLSHHFTILGEDSVSDGLYFNCCVGKHP